MDLALNNRQMLISHKTQTTNQPTFSILIETLSISSRVWTWNVMFIFYYDNNYVIYVTTNEFVRKAWTPPPRY